MDKKEIIRRIKPFASVLSSVLVIACAGVSLHDYKAPVYAAEDAVTQDHTKKEGRKDQVQEEDTTEMPQESFDLEDGVYQGTGTGFAGDIVVAVQIKDKQIVSIDILSCSDDAAFFNRAKDVIDKIIASQQLDVDTVSGATFSSRGIINAVKNALTGEKDNSAAGVSNAGGAAAGSSASVETVEDAKAYRDGTYYGSGTGFGGPLKVKVEISGGQIASIQIVENQDGSSYIQKASEVIRSILTSQSTNVDTVSGATYSSVGIIQAVRDALRQAAIDTVLGNEQDESDTQGNGQNQANTTVTGTFPYADGIYYGSADGYNGEITVAVVLQERTVKAILVTKSEDDDTFSGRAMDVVKNVIKTQSTEVDTVSGATYSSAGLLNAIRNALKEAERVTNGEKPEGCETDTARLEAVIDEAESLVPEDYTEASWAAVQIRLADARLVLTGGTQETVDRAADNLSSAMTALKKKDGDNPGDQKEDDEKKLYTDGTYTGQFLCCPDEDEDFEAYNLSVKITVRNDKIVSVTEVRGDGDPSNDSYIRRAANGTASKIGVVTQIVGKGTVDGIDAVSRATCSSDAIAGACRNALESAKRIP